MVGLLTFVTILVGSVTSTCLWSSFGAWLYGPEASQPHGIELQTIALLPEAGGQE